MLYINGIAIGVIELKRSTVSVGRGIRQNLSNQEQHFIRPFFTTVQLVMAGSDSQGLRYGVIGTPEKHWLRWKEAGRHRRRRLAAASPTRPNSAHASVCSS